MNDDLERFVSAVRRRLWMRRAAHHARNALLFGCLLALLVVGWQWWRQRPSFPGVLLILAAALIFAAWQCWTSRPTLGSAAAEADKHLKLNDLLATAWMLRRQGNVEVDSWARLVLRQAQECCRTHKAAEAATSSFPCRSLVAVGMTAMVILLAGAWTDHSSVTRQAVQVDGGFMTRADFQRHANHLDAVGHSLMRPERAVAAMAQTAEAAPVPLQLTAAHANSADAMSQPGQESSGRGSGWRTAQTSDPAAAPVVDRPPPPTAHFPAGKSSNTSIGAAQASGMDAGGPLLAGQTSDRDSDSPVGLWSAGHRVNNLTGGSPTKVHSVPPQYRDLVRAYFDRSR